MQILNIIHRLETLLCVWYHNKSSRNIHRMCVSIHSIHRDCVSNQYKYSDMPDVTAGYRKISDLMFLDISYLF